MHTVATRVLTEPCVPSAALVAYCPTMDLVATVTRGGAVDVWRLNGQKVFGAVFDVNPLDGGADPEAEVAAVSLPPGGRVRGICWRRDGESTHCTLAFPWFYLDRFTRPGANNGLVV